MLWWVAVPSLVSISERSSQGHGAKKNNSQSVTSSRCRTPEVMLCDCVAACQCVLVTDEKAQRSPVCQDPYCKCMTHNAQVQLLGCPQLRQSVRRLPPALDSLWHICTEAEPAGPHSALLTGACPLCACQPSNWPKACSIQTWCDCVQVNFFC